LLGACSTHLDVETLEVGDLVGVDSTLVDGARRHLLLLDDAVEDGDAVIVISEGGSLVNDSGTRVGGNVGVADDPEGTVGVLDQAKSQHPLSEREK
jgi:hypothetical protein